jgi:hypothetical protein
MAEKVFRSSINIALYMPVCLFLVGDAAFEIVAAHGRWQSSEGAAALLCTLVFLFFLWLGFTRYIVSADELRVICGPVYLRYSLAEIIDVRPTHSILTAPAMSLDRIEVRFLGGASVIVSPANKTAFVEALMAKISARPPPATRPPQPLSPAP